MGHDELPTYTPVESTGPKKQQNRSRPHRRHRRRAFRLVFLAFLAYSLYTYWNPRPLNISVRDGSPKTLNVAKLQQDYAVCAKLRSVPSDPSGSRSKNARWNGSPATLIKNTTIWTGEAVHGNYSWVSGDVLIQYGLITKVAGHIAIADLPDDTVIHDGTGRMLTSGIIDMHSHTGVDSLPNSRGGEDTNELSSDTTPYVRSIDGFNPLDPQIQIIKSGGVTTSLILPGSGNNIGGEAYVLKHAVGPLNGRSEISADDMLADPDRNWRYMKMACGENAKRVYGRVGRHFGPFSRLGEAWYFRHAFEQARSYNQKQDDWCAAADQFGAEAMQDYLPTELEWESLGAVLRGQVYVNTHCYTIPDLEAYIRHTNEFKFSVRAFHHAHETYLVPEILKRNYGGRPPAAALFADNMFYKQESYMGSEQAGKILNENGITPVYVSDNPVLNAQHVVFEAAKAHMYGLPYHVALAGVTSASAELLGLGERIGKVKAGFDADLALWDSDPLSVGATPVQVWIDGAPQFADAVEIKKPAAKPLEKRPEVPTMAEASTSHQDMIITGVTSILLPDFEELESAKEATTVLIVNGSISCISSCTAEIATMGNAQTLHLENGHMVPPATALFSHLGLEEISAETDTKDGNNNAESYSAAAQGLSLDLKTLRAAYRHGVTTAITAPGYRGGGFKGSSVSFRVNAAHALETHAILEKKNSVHYSLLPSTRDDKTPSTSSEIAALEAKLLHALSLNTSSLPPTTSQETLDILAVLNGTLPLVITVHKADTIAALLSLHSLLTSSPHSVPLRLIIHGGAEAHILAPELAAAKVPVILAAPYPYSFTWDQRRSLTGAPLTNGTAIDVLLAAGVKLRLGTEEDWQTRDLYLYAGIARANSGGAIGEKEALGLVTGGLEGLFGKKEVKSRGWVVSEGSVLEGGRVRGVSDGTGKVDVWN
nr:hypothetical protein B0A51_16202 [Rachicladosporium sp. CCFEE 5018]